MHNENQGNVPEEPHGATIPEPHHAVPYFKVFGTLLIASIKASLVALFFMHLKFEGKLIYLILVVPVCLCILLVCALIPDVLHGPLFNVFLRPH
jgi:cytochrome c oxidase subunit IV